MVAVFRHFKSVPHVRGDEPDIGGYGKIGFYVFPTCVGMNRSSGNWKRG